MKILFIFHEAHLTGATLVLFRNVKWYSEHTDMTMSFLLKENGLLKNELAHFGTVYYWNQEVFPKGNKLHKLFDRFKRPKSYRNELIASLRKQNFDILYVNTIVCSDIIAALSSFNCKIIWHIHELELAIKCIGKHHLEADKYVHHIIANSESTKNNLMMNGIDENKISVHYPLINIKKIQNSLEHFPIKDFIKVPSDAFVIGSSGSGIDRKGIQNFIQLPLIINNLFPENNFYYLWVGKIFNEEVIKYDLQKTGLIKNVLFVGEQMNPFPYYELFDIFVSFSKEESFGLSALEAAALHKPLVCFKNTGGIEELVEQAGNITIPYLDMIKMGQKLIEMQKDSNMLHQLGCDSYLVAQKYEENIVMPQMYNFLKLISEKLINA